MSVSLARENLRWLRELFLQKNLALFTIQYSPICQFANSQSFRDHPGFKDLCECNTVYVYGVKEYQKKSYRQRFSNLINVLIKCFHESWIYEFFKPNCKVSYFCIFFVYFDLKTMSWKKNPRFRIRENKWWARSHCLDLDLNGLLTRRNFWHIPGMLGNHTIPKWKKILKSREPILRKSYLSTFIHINKHMDGARDIFWIKSLNGRIQNFQKLPKWHFFTHAWKSKFFWAKCLFLKC